MIRKLLLLYDSRNKAFSIPFAWFVQCVTSAVSQGRSNYRLDSSRLDLANIFFIHRSGHRNQLCIQNPPKWRPPSLFRSLLLLYSSPNPLGLYRNVVPLYRMMRESTPHYINGVIVIIRHTSAPPFWGIMWPSWLGCPDLCIKKIFPRSSREEKIYK